MKCIQPLHLSHTVTNLCTNGRDDYTKADVQVLIALVKCQSHCFPTVAKYVCALILPLILCMMAPAASNKSMN